MMENPYLAPNSNLTELLIGNALIASRLKRFSAFVIDFIIYFISALPFYIVKVEVFNAKEVSNLTTSILSMLWSIIMFVLLNGFLIKEYGQTIGKWVCNIYIAENPTKTKSNFSNIFFKRYLPLLIIVGINYIGVILLLIDFLFVFRDDKRCIHDLIANTQVLEK